MDEASKTPIYRQIADWLDRQITSGALPAGHRLLTERALCAQLQVARGTVKNAYIELEKRGRIEKVQGRGTFVVGGSAEKEREDAVNAIRRAVERLRVTGMGEQEIEEAVRQEAWSRLHEEEKIRVAWVDCSPELLSTAVAQISVACGVHATAYLIEEVARRPKLLTASPFDLVATSLMHYDDLSAALPGKRVECVALSVKSRTVSGIARLAAGERAAVLYVSGHFATRVRDFLAELGTEAMFDWHDLRQPLDALYESLPGYRLVVVPPDYQEGRSQALAEAVRRCGEQGVEILPFEYLLDKGSLIHLEELAQECWLARVRQEQAGLR